MLNFKLLNPRDLIFIALVAVAVHVLAKPLYAAIDNAAGSAQPDAS